MKFFNVLFGLMIFTMAVHSQTLFEEDTSKKSVESATLQLNVTKVPKKSVSSGRMPRFLSANLESVIARGDVQVLYELPQGNGWSAMFFLHANPQSEFNGQTGDLGAMVGGRSYLADLKKEPSVFLQGLVGFNHNNHWDLMISVEIGQRIYWKKHIFLDLSLAVNRSYASQSKDPMAYLKANLAFELNHRLLPFL